MTTTKTLFDRLEERFSNKTALAAALSEVRDASRFNEYRKAIDNSLPLFDTETSVYYHAVKRGALWN